MSKQTNYYNNCNSFANQYMFLVAIFASIIGQEIDDDEDDLGILGILGSFLVALGEELALASEIRITCKARLESNNNTETQTLDSFDRSYIVKRKKKKVIKKKGTSK